MQSKLKTTITVSILIVLAIHLFLLIALTFFPKSFHLGHSKPAKVYEYLVHLGPFYREEAIRSTPHLVVSRGNQSTDIIVQHATAYQQNPWLLSEIFKRDYIRRFADQLSSRSELDSVAFRRVYQLSQSSSNKLSNDSTEWIYYHRYFQLATNTFVNDTVFHYKFRQRK